METPLSIRSEPVPRKDLSGIARGFSMTLSMITLAVISILLSRRIPVTRSWKKLPPTSWIVIITYVDSYIFVFLSAVVKDLGINNSKALCQGAILFCLVCYLTTKILIYIFLVERAYIVMGSTKPRYKDKLWMFNCIGLMVPYVVIAVLNFVYRIGYINHEGVCIIGMQRKVLIPLVAYDVAVNVYLTLVFVVPLRRLYSYRHGCNSRLRTIAIRTFIGSCFEIASSIVNIVTMTVLDGEPGWICLVACNSDVLFSVCILHWVTVTDKENLLSTTHRSSRSRNPSQAAGGSKPPTRAGPPAGIRTSQIHTVINTKAASKDPDNISDSEDVYPLGRIHARTEYCQEVETERKTMRTGSISEIEPRHRSNGGSSSSAGAMV